MVVRASPWIAGACVALAAMSAERAEAAWETETLTAAEQTHALPNLDIGLTWDRLQKRAKITREWIQDDNGTRTPLDVKELRYTEITQRLLVDARIGIYHDLELHLRAPIILQDSSDIRFAVGVPGRSTIYGSPNADDADYAYRYPITEVPASRERSGFGDMSFGLAWSPVTDKKDEAYPTITLRADLIAPTGKTRDPTDPASLTSSGGGVGLGSTQFDFSLGVSRRMRTDLPTFDPYMVFGALLTVPGPSQQDKGFEPAPEARFLVGTEIVVDEDIPTEQRYAIDFSFGVHYIGVGRTYSELSDYLPNFDQTRVHSDVVSYTDYANPANYPTATAGARCGILMGVPCGELNRVDEYLRLESTLAFHIRPSKWALFRAGIGFGINTDHFLTTERVGTDTDPPSAENQVCGGSACVGRVNASNSQGKDERSPYYDPRYDAPGRRLRIEETTLFTLFFTGMITF